MATLSRGLRWTLLSIALLVSIVAAVPFLVPIDHFIPEVTRIASEKLGQPVGISDLRLHLVPTPRIVATDLSVGKRSELRIGKLEIVPELLSFLSEPRAIRLIRAEEVEVQEAALAIPGRMPKREAGEPLRVRQILLKQVKLHHSVVKLPEFDLDLELGEHFFVELAHLETRDKSLRLTLDPEEGGIATVLLEARDWTLPAGAPLTFETLTAQGTLKGEHLDLPKVDGRLYGGTLSGHVRADWSKQWQLSGKANLAGVDVVPVQRALGKKPQLSGRLKANATFSARARSPDQLANALLLEGPFEMIGGAYQGYDLSRLGALTIGKLAPGGSTHFDELKGKLQLHGKQVKIADLCARSPLLVAGGNVDVAPDQKVSGKLDVSVAKTGGFVGIPVALGGTASDPSFTPTKGYLIGAAVGTVLLPGIGTSIGSSVGTRIEGQSDCK